MKFKFNDGGRAEAGFKGDARDCVVRSVAIATGIPYREVYDEMHRMMRSSRRTLPGGALERVNRSNSPNNGVPMKVLIKYLTARGWEWVATMGIGTGCQVHLRSEDLPLGDLIVRVSKHVTCVRDWVIEDTYDCSREGTRCVYGYFKPAA